MMAASYNKLLALLVVFLATTLISAADKAKSSKIKGDTGGKKDWTGPTKKASMMTGSIAKDAKRTFKTISAYASGEQEVPRVPSTTAARFEISFPRDFSDASFKLEVENGVNIRLGHLHCGQAGANGPVIVNLYLGPAVNITGTLAMGTLTAANVTSTCNGVNVTTIASLYDSIRSGRVYLNVHSSANPSGEVRAQLYEVN